MARKSNKTAHVLNLLSGQESAEDAEKETQAPASTMAAPEAASDPAPASTPSPVVSTPEEVVRAAQPGVPSNISIIDNGPAESDPVAEQIRDTLLKSLDETLTEPETNAVSEEPIQPKTTTQPEAAASEEANEEESDEEKADEEESDQEEILDLDPEIVEEPETPPAEPEPDYVMVNVMQRIVEDKIIYYMKQFEVCTCPRCKADTIALTLTGLPAKYMVMDKFAVDPMISYLTSRLISQVTVEALKACTQVKENPRH